MEVASNNPLLVRIHYLTPEERTYCVFIYCLIVDNSYLMLSLPKDETVRARKITQFKKQVSQVKSWIDITNSLLIKKYYPLNFPPQKAKCGSCSKLKPVLYYRLREGKINFQLTTELSGKIESICHECLKRNKDHLEKEKTKPMTGEKRKSLINLIYFFNEIEQIFGYFER